jgi:hypothetical protein
MNSANVYIVETPLQLLNAIEARHFFNFKNNQLIIRVGGTGFPQMMLKSMVDDNHWDRVTYFSFNNKDIQFKSNLLGGKCSNLINGYMYDYQKSTNRRMINNISFSVGKIDNIFLGNYLFGKQLYMRHFANTSEHKKTYLLDDGTDVLLINNYRARKTSESESDLNISKQSGLKWILRNILFDWDNTEADSVIFFSAYDIDVGNNDKLIRNEYKYIRSNIEKGTTNDCVYFLGQCMVQDNCMKEEVYFEYLKKVCMYFHDKTIYYIPHPRESENIIRRISESIGMKVRKFDVPIEYAMSIKGNTPGILASFFCSALQNCKIIYGDSIVIKCIFIKQEHMSVYNELARNTYKYYSKNTSIEVVMP